MAIVALFAQPVMAQNTGQIDRLLSLPVPPITAVINYKQLFDQSGFGIRFAEELRDAKIALQNENDRYTEEFLLEERRIVELRKQDDKTEYESASQDFHAEVTSRREIQDLKSSQLEEWLLQQESLFREAASLPIIRLARARGITAILSAENMIWFSGSVDMTQDALQQIDLEIGDGTQLDGYVSAVEFAGIELPE